MRDPPTLHLGLSFSLGMIILTFFVFKGSDIVSPQLIAGYWLAIIVYNWPQKEKEKN